MHRHSDQSCCCVASMRSGHCQCGHVAQRRPARSRTQAAGAAPIRRLRQGHGPSSVWRAFRGLPQRTRNLPRPPSMARRNHGSVTRPMARVSPRGLWPGPSAPSQPHHMPRAIDHMRSAHRRAPQAARRSRQPAGCARSCAHLAGVGRAERWEAPKAHPPARAAAHRSKSSLAAGHANLRRLHELRQNPVRRSVPASPEHPPQGNGAR